MELSRDFPNKQKFFAYARPMSNQPLKLSNIYAR